MEVPVLVLSGLDLLLFFHFDSFVSRKIPPPGLFPLADGALFTSPGQRDLRRSLSDRTFSFLMKLDLFLDPP